MITTRTVSIFLTLPMPIYNIYTTCQSGKSKYSTLKEVIRPLLPFSFLFIVSTIWALCSKSDVLGKDPRIYFYTVGTLFSNISVSVKNHNSHLMLPLILVLMSIKLRSDSDKIRRPLYCTD